MAHIHTTVDKDRDTTFLILSGVVSAEDVIGALKDFYGTSCTTNAIWDFSGSNLKNAKPEHLAAVLSVAKDLAHLRSGGKTALVVPEDLGFGMARMYEAMADLKDHPVKHGVFRTLDEARNWLGVPAGMA